MSEIDRGRAAQSTADIYETYYVPAVFAQWGERVADAAQIGVGQHVLDVACGTGALARAIAKRVGVAGAVTGFDKSAAMLAVAQQRNPAITWQQGSAESLPFQADTFDAVVSQFGLMFFENRHKAIQEMLRVLKPGGRLAVAVWDALEHSPGDAAMVETVRRLFGDAAAQELSAPFALGDVQRFRGLFDDARLTNISVTTMPGTSRFDALSTWVNWVYSDIRNVLSPAEGPDEPLAHLHEVATIELARFVMPDGAVEFTSPAHILTAVKVGGV